MPQTMKVLTPVTPADQQLITAMTSGGNPGVRRLGSFSDPAQLQQWCEGTHFAAQGVDRSLWDHMEVDIPGEMKKNYDVYRRGYKGGMAFHVAVRGSGMNEELLVLLYAPAAWSGGERPPASVLWSYT